MAHKPRVLILCTGNSARSQMAEGLLRHDYAGMLDVSSAGTNPTAVRPEAVQVMQEIGIDISSQTSKHVDDFNGQYFDLVVTVCNSANESCPVFFGAPRRVHWDVADPAAVTGDAPERLAAFRGVRDTLRAALKHLVESAPHPS